MTKVSRSSWWLATGLIGVALTPTMPGDSYAQERHFDGFYGGIEAGWDRYRFDPRGPFVSSTSGPNDFKVNALYYGGLAGWRHQTRSNWVIGLEARFGASTAGGEFTNLLESGDIPSEFDAGREFGIDLTGGYVLGAEQRTLIFATIGFYNARIRIRPTDANFMTANPDPFLRTDRSMSGMDASLGFEYAVNDQFHLRLTGRGVATFGNSAFGQLEESRGGFQVLGGFIATF